MTNTLTLASWNVNSVNSRLEHILDWLARNPVDLLGLQETKCADEKFPFAAFEEAGWHVQHHGMPAYNGVAFITKQPLEHVVRGFPSGDLLDQPRVLATRIAGVDVINLYCPQGQDVESPKFAFKENFYAAVASWLNADFNPENPTVIFGDFNIAPEDIDTHSGELMAGRVMFTDVEHDWLKNITDLGYHDAFRACYPHEQEFSWWDYRAGSWQRNKGLRIDLHLVSSGLLDSVSDVVHHKDERAKEKPSDHVPVVLELKL